MIEYIERYNEEFEDGFPGYMILRGRSDEEAIEIIKRCLKEHKDVYELGYVSNDDDIIY